jgi:parallel beta-helix repeat protein
MNSSAITSDAGGWYQFDLGSLSGGYQTGDEIRLQGYKADCIGSNSTSVTGSGGQWFNLTLSTHSPIRIGSDSDFDAFHGVAGGSGTALDPFIIERRAIDGTGFGYCIYVGNTTAHFVVRNCTFTNASMDSPPYRELALTLSNVTNGQVRDNELYDSHRGIGLTSGTSSCEIIGNHLFNISELGIRLFSSCGNNVSANNCSYDSCGIFILVGSNYNIVSDNTASYESIGIYIYACGDNQIRGNTCTNNGQSGIVLSQTGRIVLENNNCSFSNPGILIYGGQQNVISNNTVLHNSIGILFQAWAGNDTVVDNNCSFNTGTGIYLDTSTDNLLSNNTCDSNSQYGIHLGSSSGNTLINNICNSNVYYGIEVDHSSSNTLSNNTCSDNCGILLSFSSGNALRDNNCSDNYHFGVYVSYSDGNTLANNTCSDNGIGIEMRSSSSNTVSYNICTNNIYNDIGHMGINVEDSSNGNILDNNNCSDNDYGIWVSSSNSNDLDNNICSNNSQHGIYLNGGSGNTLTDNICSNNLHQGIYLYSSGSNIVRNNTCLSNPEDGVHLDYSSNVIVEGNILNSNADGSGIHLYSSGGSTLANNTCSHNLYGMLIVDSTNVMISYDDCSLNSYVGIWIYRTSASDTLIGNNCSGNQWGMMLHGTSNNILRDNICNSNSEDGIYLDDYANNNNMISQNEVCDNIGMGIRILTGSNNRIWNNTFTDNNGAGSVYDTSHAQACDSGTSNWWNSTDGYGNWWSDWTRPDADGDGIVDLPYAFASNQDNYPLTDDLWACNYTLHLLHGWNLVSIPLADFVYHASTLGLSAGDVVCEWDPSSQLYSRSYIVGGPPPLDFEMRVGMGYFIFAAAEENLTLLGYSPDKYSSYSTPLDVPSGGGWVMIGWTSFDSSQHASDIASYVTGAHAKLICKWDAETGMYLSYVVGSSPPPYDFVVLPGDAMWMWVDAPGGTLTYSP